MAHKRSRSRKGKAGPPGTSVACELFSELNATFYASTC